MSLDSDTRSHQAPLGEDLAPAPSAKPGRASRWVMILVGLVVIGGLAYVVRTRRSSAPTSAPSGAATDRVVPVVVVTVTQKNVPIWLEGLGNALPIATVTVKAQVDGRLDAVFFKEGQQVHKGQLLAQIDPRPFTIALHNAQAAFQRDSAQLRAGRLNLDRYKTLRQQNLISQQQVDDQQALADQYTATTMSDQAAIDAAKLNLDYARIVSPLEGVTGVRNVDPGNLVHASDATGIVTLTQLDPMAVMFTLPEDDLPRVQQHLAAGAIPVEAFNRDGTLKLATGELTLIDNQVNATTATIRLKAMFPNATHSLWPNEFVKARLLLSTQKNAVVVPATVVQRGPQGTFAYVVAQDDTVTVRPVVLDTTQGESAIIARGLQPGERVVSDGQNQLRPGAKVQPRTADRSTAPVPSASAAP